jgi:hypothetical protein
MDDECIREVCSAPFRGATWDRVVQAVRRENGRHDLKVAYEIILDHKQAKQRTAEVMMLMQVRVCVRAVRARARVVLCGVVWWGMGMWGVLGGLSLLDLICNLAYTCR